MTADMTNLLVEFLRNKEKVFEEIKESKKLSQLWLGATLIIIFFSAIYGAVMGLFAGGFVIIMDSIKIPLLFLISLIASLPAYYIIGALTGVRISLRQMLTILSITFAVASTILMAFVPIVFIYSIAESSYSSIHNIHYLLFSLAGLGGAYYLFTGVKSAYGKEKKSYNWFWPLIVGGLLTLLVGIKLAWILRPFFHYHQYFFEGLGILL